MRRGVGASSSEEVRIPIKPTLEHYGADYVPDNERWSKMRCINPEHEDRNGSASVNTAPDFQLFVCHGCGLKGNAAQIIMKLEDCDFQTAVASAAEYAGQSTEGVLRKPRSGSRLSGDEGNLTRTRRYRRVGRGHRRGRGPRDEDG